MITSYALQRVGTTTTVTVVSNLGGAPIFYHWYADGAWLGATAAPSRVFNLPAGVQMRIEVLDTLEADFDGVAHGPDTHPPRRTLFWVRSVDATTTAYRVEQNKDGGGWTTLATVAADARWLYRLVTDRLEDLADYAWRMVPVDAAGNDGTPVTLDTETIVRRPDAPAFEIAFDDGTDRVTFSAA